MCVDGGMWLWIEGRLQFGLGGVVAADHMRQRSLNNEEADGKTRYVAFISTAGIKNGKYFKIHSHGRGAIQMVFISPVKEEHMQPFYMMKSNIGVTAHA